MLKIAFINDLNSLAMCYDNYRVFYGQKANKDETINFIQNELESNNSKFIISIEENNIVGFLRYQSNIFGMNFKETITIIDLYIEPKYRGKYRGLNLIQNLIESSKMENIAWITVGTSIENDIANQLYKKLGFKLDQKTNFYSYSICI